MLTGQLPFTAYTDSSFMQRHVYHAVPSACKIAPHLSEGCDVLLAKAMAKDPAKRFSSASELLAELSRLSEESAQAAAQEAQKELLLQEVPLQEVPLQEVPPPESLFLDETIPPPFIPSPEEEPDLKAQQAEYRLIIENANQVHKHDPINPFALNMRANADLLIHT
jgi:serine/threonine protein kinase